MEGRIYTRTGDDGTTGRLYGGRVAKTDPAISASGSVDEAQSFLGLARAGATPDGELDRLLVALERDLYVVGAELGTSREQRHKLVVGRSLVSAEMVAAIEAHIDDLDERYDMPKEFVIPGQDLVGAHLDVARTVVRRAERDVLAIADLDPASLAAAYLNRLSDLLWALARWQEQGASLASRVRGKGGSGS